MALAGSAPAQTTTPPGTEPQRVTREARISDVLTSPTRRRVRVGVVIGACTERIDVARLVQGRTTVEVALQVTNRVETCAAIGLYRCVLVTLDRPLGRRRVVDLTTGRRVGRPDGRNWPPSEMQLLARMPCRPPGPVAPWRPPR